MELKKNNGQFLLESIVALGVLTIAILSIFPLISNSIGFSRHSTNTDIAVGLASEGIEVIKNILDTNTIAGDPWNQGLTNCASGCSVQYDSTSVGNRQGDFLKFNSGVYHYSSGTDTPFQRTITILNVPAGSPFQLQVRSRVSWIGRNGNQESVLMEDRFFDWR